MFGIGLPELIVIMIVALLVVGPKKLPELARSIGKTLGEFRRMADEVKETINEEVAKEEIPDEESGVEQSLLQKNAQDGGEDKQNYDLEQGQHNEVSVKKEKPASHRLTG